MPSSPSSSEPSAGHRRGAAGPRGLALLLGLALLSAAGGALPAPTARAESFVVDVALGSELAEQEIEAGDVHRYRLALTAGLVVKVEARADDDETVTLRLFAPDGSEFRSATGERARIDLTVPTTGTWIAEVTTSLDEAEYEFRSEAQAGGTDPGGGGTTGPGETAVVHLDVPRGASVRVDVRRTSGAAPEVVAVRDGAGRSMPFVVQRRDSRRVRLIPLAVTAPGGLGVEVRGEGGAAGTYTVTGEIEDLDDHEGEESDDDREERRLVLTLRPGADPATVAASLGYELEAVGDGFIVVRTPSGREGREDEDAADADTRSDDVIGGEPDRIVEPPEGTGTLPILVGSDLGRTQFEAQWALGALRHPLAVEQATGVGVIVAVLDTGIDRTHEAFVGRNVLAGRDFVDGDTDPSEATDGLDQDADGVADEGYGHGTFVAGLVALTAPGATILPVRVLDTEGRGRVSAIAEGIAWAVAQGADVVNLSFGTDQTSPLLGDAVRAALNRGVFVVASSGNGGVRKGIDFPASVAGVLAIGGTDERGAPAIFSDGVGTTVTVAAPAVGIVGPLPGGWGRADGTSFAAAFASGGAALRLESFPAPLPGRQQLVFRGAVRPAPKAVPAADRRRLGAGRLDLPRLLR